MICHIRDDHINPNVQRSIGMVSHIKPMHEERGY
jgi:hypothetical protein